MLEPTVADNRESLTVVGATSSKARRARHSAAAVWLGILAMLTAGLVGVSTSTATAGPPAAPEVIDDTPIAEVNTVAVSNGITYVGGNFTGVGANTGNGAKLSATDGVVDRSFPGVNGTVNTVIADGAGGFYIGGTFTAVNGVTRNRLARILANGNLDPQWNPNVGGDVFAMALSGGLVYVGGSFTTINGALTRNRLAALDATTGVANSWDPNVSVAGAVRALAISGSTVYFGGNFSGANSVNGNVTRNRAAAVDATSGVATAWNPDPSGQVNAIAVSGSTVYLGGNFLTINVSGTPASRNRLAAVDASTGTVSGWNPNADGGQVLAMAIAGTTIYIGGGFTTLSGGTVTRNRAAAVDASTGLATAWNPDVSGNVTALLVSGSTVYLGGLFAGTNSVNGTLTRNRLAAVDATTGTATAWDPNANNNVNALAISGGDLYAGGTFTHVNVVTRNRAAAFDANGRLTAWDPNVSDRVRSIVISGSTAYLGGSFNGANSVNGTLTRNRLAAVDTTTGVATSWDPNANGNVFTMVLSGTTMYVGGDFNGPNSINGTLTRNRAAALDASTGIANGWNPNVSDTVRALAVSGSTVYMGGLFNGANAINETLTRNRAAAVDATTGTATAWDPNVAGNVNALLVSGSTVYLGGNFSGTNSINASLTRNRLAAVDATTGVATSWDPNASNIVNDIRLSGSTMYVGGQFTTINGVARNRVAAVDPTTGVATAWNPDAVSTVNALFVSGSSVVVGGNYSSLGVAASAPATNLATTPVLGANPGQGRVANLTGSKLTWTPPQAGGIAQYFVLYRAQGATYPWAIYATGTANPGISLNNPGTRNTCSAANTAMGWTSCPMVRGWQPGTTYEFAVITRSTEGRNSLNPVTPLTTYTVPVG